MSIKGWVKSSGEKLHARISSSRFTARLYLNSLGYIVRIVPDGINKSRILNSIQTVSWPDLDFSPREVFVTRQTKIKLTPHIGEFDFASLFLKRLDYESEVFDLLEPKIEKYDVIVEIGANVGIYTNFFHAVLKKAKKRTPIFAFEPSSKAFLRLEQNLESNKVDHVSIFNCAVADKTDFAFFFEPEGHLTNGSLDMSFASLFSTSVHANPILVVEGQLLAKLLTSYARILLKIDAEGAEIKILSSLKTLILANRPDIVLEVLSHTEGPLNELTFMLERYRLFNITDQGLVQCETFVANNRFRDYFLLPA